jgi:hypothetical protein
MCRRGSGLGRCRVRVRRGRGSIPRPRFRAGWCGASRRRAVAARRSSDHRGGCGCGSGPWRGALGWTSSASSRLIDWSSPELEPVERDEVRPGDRSAVVWRPLRPRKCALIAGSQPLFDEPRVESQPRTRAAAEANGAEPVGVLVDPRSRHAEAPSDLSRRHQPFIRRRNRVLAKQIGYASRDRLDDAIVEKRLAAAMESVRLIVRRIHIS